MKLNWNFKGGGGGGGASNQNTILGGGMDVSWNHTFNIVVFVA